ncbi:metal-dependent hydrolase [Haloarcula litorea]|uniref:metal-dependent hydrolase n=1 Tax=Haloarcula litorea TaxID=3032579 RepID=UPI0023E8473C|nr:metal-dependent hydrolase [Halomicroarcula sp. GDY20]
MFVGHALLAFAVVATAARRLGRSPERSLRLGAVAGLFAAVPDVDVVYAPVGLALRSVQTLGPDAFWATANVIHRGPTHSLAMGTVLAVAVGLWATERRSARAASAALVAALVAVGAVGSGAVGGVVVLVYALAGLAVAAVARRCDVGAAATFGVALVGLLSHPFGDLFTGSPPPLLYPLDVALVTERVLLYPDPTGHLLAAFALELGVVWLAVRAYVRLSGHRLRELVSPRASLGAGYAAAALALPAPTLADSAHFVFSVLAVGVVGAPVRPLSGDDTRLRALVTGLTAVTLAAVAYAVAYGLL